MSDLSSLFEMLNNKGGEDSSFSNSSPSLDEILNSVSPNNSSSTSNADSDFQMPDMETITKIMKLMKSINSNSDSPSANLLYSLKPFLRDSKKDKVEQCVKILKISSIISEINKSGGDF